MEHYRSQGYTEEDREHMRDFALIAKGLGYPEAEIARRMQEMWGLRLRDAQTLMSGGIPIHPVAELMEAYERADKAKLERARERDEAPAGCVAAAVVLSAAIVLLGAFLAIALRVLS